MYEAKRTNAAAGSATTTEFPTGRIAAAADELDVEELGLLLADDVTDTTAEVEDTLAVPASCSTSKNMPCEDLERGGVSSGT